MISQAWTSLNKKEGAQPRPTALIDALFTVDTNFEGIGPTSTAVRRYPQGYQRYLRRPSGSR